MSTKHPTPEEAIAKYTAALQAYTAAEYLAQQSRDSQIRRIAGLHLVKVGHTLAAVLTAHSHELLEGGALGPANYSTKENP